MFTYSYNVYDNNKIKPEINNRKISGKYSNI